MWRYTLSLDSILEFILTNSFSIISALPFARKFNFKIVIDSGSEYCFYENFGNNTNIFLSFQVKYLKKIVLKNIIKNIYFTS